MKIIRKDVVSSTNDVAKEYLKDYDKIVVIAECQSKGRGRNRNQWFGSKGNVYYSIGLKHNPPREFQDAMLLQALGAIAVKNILDKLSDNYSFLLKYPNDVLVKSKGIYKKISGVVTENSFQGGYCSESVIGIGVNVSQSDFPDEIKNLATSLSILGIEEDKEKVINNLTAEIEKLLKSDTDNLMNIWKKYLNIENKEVLLQSDKQKYIISKLNNNGTLTAHNQLTGQEIIIDNGDSIRYEYE